MLRTTSRKSLRKSGCLASGLKNKLFIIAPLFSSQFKYRLSNILFILVRIKNMLPDNSSEKFSEKSDDIINHVQQIS